MSQHFHVRPEYGDQDPAIVREVYERDCYGIRELRARRFAVRRVVDVGAHIGAFARLVHEVYPEADVACVEVDPANVALLRQNASFAPLIAAACTYEAGDLQLFSTVHPLGRTTGGGFVAPRGSTSYLGWENAEEYAPRPSGDSVTRSERPNCRGSSESASTGGSVGTAARRSACFGW